METNPLGLVPFVFYLHNKFMSYRNLHKKKLGLINLL